MSVHLDVGQRVSELLHRGRRGLVDEHLFGLGVRRHVVDDGDSLVEEVSAPGLDVAAHAVVCDSLPLETGDELARHSEQVAEQMRERLARCLLHRQHLDSAATDHQMIAVALDG